MRWLKRLKPYGRVLPVRVTRRDLKAWALGISDGWAQPYDLSVSRNIEHLMKHMDDTAVYESLDSGINLGQWLRSPLNHQQEEEA